MARLTPRPDTPAEEAARAGHHLEVRCLVCRRQSMIPAGVYGEAGDRPLNRLSEILRCKQCGTRGRARVWLAERR